ncbi:MAG: molybdopterin-dependent oxidoreductase, partial [Planctomycetota bacterium]|nr:molybdopterin-dependent oxidoreductase [Planctomycetota bacterium]
MRDKLPFEHFSRRDFMKVSGGTAATAGLFQVFPNEFVSAEEAFPSTGKRQLQAQCPYCGVGCGCLVQVEGDTIVGMVPDKAHPTNKGIQCIKGLNANEPVYKDRIEHCLIRKDMSDPLTGHVSDTKGRFDESVFRKASYEEGEEIVAEKMAAIAKKFGGNSIGLNGSGQLTMEGQYLENLFMKGILTSNSIEANARMCMTSAVTGYFATYGSDTPPTCYDDIEMSDFVSFWGHNPREAHPVLFWRVADHKKNTDISTLVSDPRRTGTVTGLEDINPRNSHHFATINGDISYLNAIAHVIINKYPEAVMPEKWLDEKTSGWKEYIEGIKARYSPEKTQEVTGLEPDFVREIASLWADATRKGN